MDKLLMIDSLPIIMAVAFVLAAPIFLYYYAKSASFGISNNPMPSASTQSNLPEFLMRQHVDRSRRIRHYQGEQRQRTRKARKRLIDKKLVKKSTFESGEQNLGICCVGLQRFVQINQNHKLDLQESIPFKVKLSDRRTLAKNKIKSGFKPTSLTTILEDVEY